MSPQPVGCSCAASVPDTTLRRSGGWTLLELLTTITVVGVLSAIGYNSYGGAVERSRVAQAAMDITKICMAIEVYSVRNGDQIPDALDQIGMGLIDPWGEPYQYLSFETLTAKTKSSVRKDHNLHPLNSRFDLYSKGPDRDSRAPLTAKASRDDIIMASDGAFVGRASDY